MYLSQPKMPTKPTKSAQPVFGKITRSPRTPASSSLFTESDESRSQGVQYSDTFISESVVQGKDYKKKKSPSKNQTSFRENDIRDTIESAIPYTGKSLSEVPYTGRNGKSHTEKIWTEIETCISENDSEKFVTVTEKLPSMSEIKSSQSLYSDTFESDRTDVDDDKSQIRTSVSDQGPTGYDYSDTFNSTERSNGLSCERDSRSLHRETDRSENSYSTFVEESLTESSPFRSLEESVASASPTPESYTITFDTETEPERYLAVNDQIICLHSPLQPPPPKKKLSKVVCKHLFHQSRAYDTAKQL